MQISRRGFIKGALVAGAAAGCSTTQTSFNWRTEEERLFQTPRSDFDVVLQKLQDPVLRTRARDVPSGADLTEIAARMEKTMRQAEGVGIAGPQVGLYLRVATLLIDYKTDTPHLIFARNPVIVARSDDTIERYEGCLSVPGVGGLVRRNRWIRIEYREADGSSVTTEAENHNAVLWQHEIDHLDGVLYVDRVLGELLPMEEVRKRRKALEESEEGVSQLLL